MERKRDVSWLTNWRVLTVCSTCLFTGFLVGMLIFGSPWHLPPAWGDIPTWITATATVGLLAGAIVTAIYAIRAFRDQVEMLRIQSEQLTEQRTINAEQARVLALQAEELHASLEERKQEAQLRRRAQAERVIIGQQNSVFYKDDEDDEAAGPEGQRAAVTVVNTSDRPIYDAGILWPPGSTWEFPPFPEPLGTIMPGDRTERLQNFPVNSDTAAIVAILQFRDAASITWTRRSDDGRLVEQKQPGPQPR
jgi:Sec-independent protein translocase protein TatA